MLKSKEHSKRVQKLYGLLKRRFGKVEPEFYDNPLDAIVYAIVSENTTEAEARTAIKKIHNYFVNLNDIRVSRIDEIVDVLGIDPLAATDIASKVTTVLTAVFGKYNMVSLETLKKAGKRPARQMLAKINGISPFVLDYCVLTALQGHAIPLTKRMIEYLKTSQLVEANADEQQIQGFLTRQILAKDAYEFYALLRRETESGQAGAWEKGEGQVETPERKTGKRKK